jgi:deoxyribose-phosphate aldolase
MMNESIASKIDHSLLQPALTDAELEAGCQLARRWGVASVCIKPCAVPLAARLLAGSDVKVGTVVGFPHGSSASAVKAFEAEEACRAGAMELDMVINIGKVLGGDWQYVDEEIRTIVATAHRHGAITKVIFENDLLADDGQKIRLCHICEGAGAEFVKTSTGFGFVKQPDGHYDYRGATERDVRLMRAHVGPGVQVKAAGGIRTYADALAMIRAGASRIGATATEAIIAGQLASATKHRTIL